MSASEASRRFSAVLDEAERGETVVVTRGGRRVALIVPAPRANGAAVAEGAGALGRASSGRRRVRRRRRGGWRGVGGAGYRPVARLILDTGVLVAGVRGRLDVAAVTDEDDVALPAVVLADYLTGVVLDADPGRQAAQRAFLAELLTVMPVEDYTPTVAEHHAALLAHVRRTGRPRGAHYLIIAATARATGRLLVTTDGQAGFAELPDVQARVLIQ